MIPKAMTIGWSRCRRAWRIDSPRPHLNGTTGGNAPGEDSRAGCSLRDVAGVV